MLLTGTPPAPAARHVHAMAILPSFGSHLSSGHCSAEIGCAELEGCERPAPSGRERRNTHITAAAEFLSEERRAISALQECVCVLTEELAT